MNTPPSNPTLVENSKRRVSADRPQFTLRQKLGVLGFDLRHYVHAVEAAGGWVDVRNRADTLIRSPDGRGVRLAGEWTNALHACRIFPPLGRLLMRRALRQWPIDFATAIVASSQPEVSFVLPFRGADRLDLLRMTIASILAQRDVRVECIVVEQDNARHLNNVPLGVRYLHLPTPEPGWHKSLAFNVGVRHARAGIIVCHDADILVPCDYAREIRTAIVEQGHEAAHLQRFLFRMSEDDTARAFKHSRLTGTTPEEVWQNWQGGTLAIRKDAYWRVGGFDEAFVDWGGEDNEFFQRCSVLNRVTFGYLPFVHLWHPPQEGKFGQTRARNIGMMEHKLTIPAQQRVEQLLGRNRASASGHQ